MAIQAVFFDIDGTLLTDQRTVSRETIRAINRLREQGILVGLATGRGPDFILPYMASLSVDVAIAYNGQYIFSRKEVLYSQALDPKIVRDVLAFAEQAQLDVSFGRATGVVGSGIMSVGTGHLAYQISRLIPSSWAGGVNFVFNRLIRYVRPQKRWALDKFLQEPIYQMMVLATEKEGQALRQQFQTVSFTRSSPYAMDIISKGHSKLTGIRYLADLYGFELDQVLAFGDSNNDVEMLAGLSQSVAMKNGTQQAKSSASYVTDSNNKDGISKALLHFGLLE